MTDQSNLEKKDIATPKKEGTAPEFVYVNMDPRFASSVFTVPTLDTRLPENTDLQSTSKGLTVRLINNGKFMSNKWNPERFDVKDWAISTPIDSVQIWDETLTGEELLERRRELIDEFLKRQLGSDEAVRQTRGIIEQNGLQEGSYLYRAIREEELRRINRGEHPWFSHLDPSANFESESMFRSEGSQARYYAGKTGEDYSGKIIRWKIEEPLFYRPAGMMPPRVVPLFSHFAPKDIEVSSDGGANFIALAITK
ncbi:hypothetical protein A3H85_02935 [Candidatus Daviesbacteria bacterium RIFCSPLOWO2_02_FULL_40_8]|uniref:Uncharacterized protein n=1 Tax=Candidatus Daviesbacteria bacterium RIFCSPLOWO2_01_FULL_40_24 TaxID=1797787 RepID=A0A1F5MKE0_9BACT|nr:MAG: hypothetical protein A2780_01140 [Candidatus Daviesbacteria bacterium RIFCSPHIGHO2_01_FULL_41_45]OGE34620.1 MAG: hypothetical protein A3C32_02695 [Candidatus Daviesbacteria bacterium RIFCSPHIGHO2_02_FULL_41_14]OGE65857.1 MAG: hypothetical protein A3B49_03300 [Candidatus Daviesbacteria bacterium RIFCSPLOWO2_01_FULL_40_24]OGE67007.1 MAG: hypothetical protein A3H85_02935 [Candidatus Daviesbacteria bacterium RIFCSPLOWO2_02_FULL_40_8]